jgi:PhzF family phenazine biosynthesis protein
MEYPIYQVDAFTEKAFSGNPAAVVPLEEWLPDAVMQNIAIENNLSETAFFVRKGDGFFLRWFTPTYEIDLCGHATLATAYVIFTELYPEKNEIIFQTKEAGTLTVRRDGEKITMDFPARPGEHVPLQDIPETVLQGLGNRKPMDAYKARDLMLVFDTHQTVKNIDPDFKTLIEYPDAVIATAPAAEDGLDFVSRFFCAYDETIPEDPVTGSAHCTLVPYWAQRLGKNILSARQISRRGGNLTCSIENNRVFITGKAVLYMKGVIYV